MCVSCVLQGSGGVGFFPLYYVYICTCEGWELHSSFWCVIYCKVSIVFVSGCTSTPGNFGAKQRCDGAFDGEECSLLCFIFFLGLIGKR